MNIVLIVIFIITAQLDPVTYRVKKVGDRIITTFPIHVQRIKKYEETIE